MEQETAGRGEPGIPPLPPSLCHDQGPTPEGMRILEPLGKGSLGEVYLAERKPDGELAHLRRFRLGKDRGRLLVLREASQGRLDLLNDAVLAADLGLEDLPGLGRYVLEELRVQPITEFCDQKRLAIDARIELFVQACDGIHFAHQRGVGHLDIKPTNVVVDCRCKPFRVRVLHHGLNGPDQAESEPQLIEIGGRYLGSPGSMSPEQAGHGDQVPDLRSDVYSLGSLLYELLVGFPPHFPDQLSDLPIEEMQRRIRDQPAPLASKAIALHPRRRAIASLRGIRPASLRRQLRGDLDAILGRTLARDPRQRYGSVQALADDLRRYRALRPTEARNEHLFELLIRNSRRHARALMLIFVAGAIFTLGYWSAPLQSTPVPETARTAQNQAAPPRGGIDGGQSADLQRLRGELRRSSQHVLQLEVREFVATAQSAAQPARDLPLAEQRDALIAWLEQYAAPIESRAESIRAALAMPASADPKSRTDAEGLRATLVQIKACRQEVISALEQRLHWVEGRLSWLAKEDSHCLDDFANRWRSKIRAIARDPIYRGLELIPQPGLIPLGRDPNSGLYEFYHPSSAGGDRSLPVPDETGALRIDGDTGMIFVLIPAATLTLGAQGSDPHEPNYDPAYQDSPANVRAIVSTLEAFFLSKYELTQGQWTRLAGENGSLYRAGLRLPSGELIGPDHPVEQISWQAAWRVLGWSGLRLPTEAEWEYAGRAGKEGRVLVDPKQIEGLANLADRSIARLKPWAWDIHQHLDRHPYLRSRWPSLDFMDDGYVVHAPVGSFRANAFGMHDMHGNVAEWCEGWIEAGAEDQQVARGDHFLSRRPAPIWRRDTLGQGAPGGQPHIGVRPAKSIER